MTKDKYDLYGIKLTLEELQFLKIMLFEKAEDDPCVMVIYNKLGGLRLFDK